MIELSFSFESDSEDEQVFLQVYRSFVGNWKIKEILIAFCFKKNLRYCGLLDEIIYYYYHYFSEVERTGKIVIKSYKQGDSRELPIEFPRKLLRRSPLGGGNQRDAAALGRNFLGSSRDFSQTTPRIL